MKNNDKLFLAIIVIFTLIIPSFIVYGHHKNSDQTLLARTPENGNWSQTEIEMKTTDVLTLKIISEDVLHSFTIKSLDISVETYPGIVATVILSNIDSGTYRFACDVYCSPTHLDMFGYLVVI